MSKVTNVQSSASEEILSQSKNEIEVIDETGRKINLKKPGILAEFKLVKMLGDTAKNEVYMNMVLPLMYVSSIDGLPVALNSEKELEALIQRLDHHGIKAVVEAVMTNFANHANTDELRKEIKKS